ncbi:MAG: Fe-S protein assembly co-chaperone HscB [Buchnera aphidicola (Meitanaphis elongallis)]
MDYFQLFNLPKKFKIDKKKLVLKFYELQQKYHPDAINNNSKSKNNNLKQSINVNLGYYVLKSSCRRAEHLLLLNSYNFKKEQKYLPQSNFLYKQLKLYEKLDTLKYTIKKELELSHFINEIVHKKQYYLSELESMLNQKEWKLAAIILHKLLFYKKFKRKLDTLKNIKN